MFFFPLHLFEFVNSAAFCMDHNVVGGICGGTRVAEVWTAPARGRCYVDGA